MASGDAVLIVYRSMTLGANGATPEILDGGSTIVEKIDVWQFDDTAVEYLDFLVALEGYEGGGLTIKLKWSAEAAVNECEWEVAFRRFADDAEDLDSSHTYLFNAVTATAPSAINEVSYDDITFTDGADMDSFADGEIAVMRLRRNATSGNDDLVGDANLWSIHGIET